MVLVAVRKPDALLNAQFWAEDGAAFFLQPALTGWRSLVTPYAGYHHLVPRLIAFACDVLPAAWIPTAYAGLAGICVGVTAWLICSPRLNLPYKPLLALAPLLVAHTDEVFLCLCNLQWLLALLLVRLSLLDEPVTRGQRFSDTAEMVLVGLTGPFALLLLPLFILRALRRRTRFSWHLVVAAFVVSFVQALAVLAEHGATAATGPAMVLSLPIEGALFVQRTVADNFLGLAGCVRLGIVASCAVGGAVLGLLLAVLPRSRESRWTQAYLFLAIVLVLLAVGYRFSGQERHLMALANGDRYFFVPKVLLWWLTILAAGSAGWSARIGQALLGAAAVAALPHFVAPRLPDLGWRAFAARIDQGQPTMLRINPGPIEFMHPGRRRENSIFKTAARAGSD